MALPFEYTCGETVSIALDAVEGDVNSVTDVVAHLRKGRRGVRVVDRDAPLAAAFSVATRAASGAIPAGWTLTLSAAVTAALEPGTYMVDARLTTSTGVEISDPLTIVLLPAVTQI